MPSRQGDWMSSAEADAPIGLHRCVCDVRTTGLHIIVSTTNFVMAGRAPFSAETGETRGWHQIPQREAGRSLTQEEIRVAMQDEL